MKIEKFEDIIAWQKAKELIYNIYTIFKPHRDWGFKDQIQRAGVSVMNNIAEGFYRKSDREFKRFLTIALGSLGELKSMLILAVHLKYISEALQSTLTDQLNQIGKMINSLISYLGREIGSSK